MDIFDEIALEDKDVFDEVKSTEETSIESLTGQLSTLLEKYDTKARKAADKRITAEISSLVKAEVSKIKPVQNVIERKEVQIHVPVKLPAAPQPQRIKEIVREVIVKEEKRDKAQDEELVAGLKKEIGDLKTQLENIKRIIPVMRGGPGVIGIPAPEGNNNKVLTVKENRATWQTAASGGGGNVSTDAYTTSNVSTDRSFNATSTSIDELANVLGSLIASLQGAGIIQ